MKFINQIIGLGIVLFLFFTFSNFNSIDDIVQSISGSNASQVEKVSENEDTNLEKAIVNRVIDGDTIEVEFSGGEIETIRFLLVDTPETVKPDTPEQPFGKEASDYVKKTLIKDTVVEIERGIDERDKYDRLLAYVFKDGKNINKELLSLGLARVAFVYEPNTKYLDEFKKAEQEAKEKELGIWSIDGYVTEKGFNFP
ncbi:thermonuclease family protein [Gracilibacillus thailandensis]|uniref:Endonuclease n=1 Tax=Gracilibacillus thailandensis TaxID=563735 RepID=A0A6N7QX67_9BACI|nr:thermonuclease family protein [Gracilibacillus thailandensis]MRI66144.1 endonuclease [Gracilibacillus thailandensis]